MKKIVMAFCITVICIIMVHYLLNYRKQIPVESVPIPPSFEFVDNTVAWWGISQSFLVTCWDDGEMRTWNLDNGKLIKESKINDFDRNRLFLSPVDNFIALIIPPDLSTIRFISIIDSSCKEMVLNKKLMLIRGLGFSSDGKRFFCINSFKSSVLVIDVDTCSINYEIPFSLFSRTQITSDGNFLIEWQETKKKIETWKINNKGNKALLSEIPVNYYFQEIFVSNDNKCLYTYLSADGMLRKYSILDGKILWEKSVGILCDSSWDGTCLTSYNGKEIITLSSDTCEEVGKAKYDYSQTPKIIFRPYSSCYIYTAPLEVVKTLKEKDGSGGLRERIYYARKDNIFRVIDAISGKVMRTIEVKK
ncbi:MAG: WD40 repeat domain-containing protein [Planctomycetes bacterium]|nr:WD40 repeat domain-containing protein [Planctomycetota bacterium]